MKKEIAFLLSKVENKISRIKRLREIVSLTDKYDSLFNPNQICPSVISDYGVSPKTLGLAEAKNFLFDSEWNYKL